MWQLETMKVILTFIPFYNTCTFRYMYVYSIGMNKYLYYYF